AEGLSSQPTAAPLADMSWSSSATTGNRRSTSTIHITGPSWSLMQAPSLMAATSAGKTQSLAFNSPEAFFRFRPRAVPGPPFPRPSTRHSRRKVSMNSNWIRLAGALAVLVSLAPMSVVAQGEYRGRRAEIEVNNDWTGQVTVTLWTERHE